MARIAPALRPLMLIGAAVAMFSWLGSSILGSPRVLFAFARDGLLPRALGRVSARTHAPYVAILCFATLSVLLAITGTFAELAVLSTLTSAALYVLGCMAAWRLRRQGVAQAGAPLNSSLLAPSAIVGVTSMLALILLAEPLEMLGLLVLLALSAGGYLVARRAQLSASP